MTDQELVNTTESKYEFIGHHFRASFYQCDIKALNDIETLKKIMSQACVEAGATVLGILDKKFEVPNHSELIGGAIALLLSESHASIHTYPEYQSCFIDFFTCGTHCDANKFDHTLKLYLQPKSWSSSIEQRN